MERNFQAIKDKGNGGALLELQHNITRMNLNKVRGIWHLNVPYKRSLVGTMKQLGGSSTDPTPKQMMFLTTINFLNEYSKSNITDDLALVDAWLDGMINGTTRYWGPENGTSYKRLYNQTSGNDSLPYLL